MEHQYPWAKKKCKLQAEDLSYIIGRKVRSLHGTAARRKVPSSRGKLQHNPIYTGTAAQAPSYNLVETCPMHCHSEVLVMFAHHLKDLFKRHWHRGFQHIAQPIRLKPFPQYERCMGSVNLDGFCTKKNARRTPKTILSNPGAEIDAHLFSSGRKNQSIKHGTVSI